MPSGTPRGGNTACSRTVKSNESQKKPRALQKEQAGNADPVAGLNDYGKVLASRGPAVEVNNHIFFSLSPRPEK
jgi:hypothetical protein